MKYEACGYLPSYWPFHVEHQAVRSPRDRGGATLASLLPGWSP